MTASPCVEGFLGRKGLEKKRKKGMRENVKRMENERLIEAGGIEAEVLRIMRERRRKTK